jgi:hypothetical protein
MNCWSPRSFTSSPHTRPSPDPPPASTPGSKLQGMPSPRDMVDYMRTVARGSPVDRPWSVPGMVLSRLRSGRGIAPKDSPLKLQDVMARADYRDLRTPKIGEGDLAPDFELPRFDGAGTIRLASLLRELPVALVFGSYT